MRLSTPTLSRFRFIAANVLGYPPTNRGDTGASTWDSQRDCTTQLQQFEQTLFRKSSQVFFVPDHIMVTLDDDLYGTRSRENQVKSISTRKADKEGHSAIAVCEALFRPTLAIRFCRRGEKQELTVNEVMRSLIGNCGQVSLKGMLLTADRGFGSVRGVVNLTSFGFGSIFIFSQHLVKCHPFVCASLLSVGGREDNHDGHDFSISEDDTMHHNASDESDGDGQERYPIQQ